MKNKLLLISALSITSQASIAQTKISSGTFSVLEARILGPGTMSGRISDIEGVDADGKTLYVGTAGGGIWKSTNAGASFKPIFDKYCQSIGDIAIDQKKPKTVYVGTGESNMRNSVSIGNGIYKSTDGGENWSKLGLDSTEHISRVLIDPKNPEILYVSAPGALWSDSKHRGLYKSADAGKTWEKLFYIDDKTGCADVVIHPENSNILYVSMWQFRRKPYEFSSGGKTSGLYKSTDAGKTWKKITNGLPSGDLGRIALALAPSEPNKMVAIVEAKETGLYISSDGGETWKSQSATSNITARPFYFSTIKFDPKDSKRLYRPAFNFAYSDDGGYSYSDATNDGGWVHSDHHALWINPNNTNIMYLGTDGGVYISLDRGATFIFCKNLPVGQFYHATADNKEPYNVYGGLQDNGSWRAPSSKPGGVGNGDWTNVYFGDGFWTIPDLNNPDVMYAESQGGNMARIDFTTLKSYDIQPKQADGEEKLRWNWNTPIVIGKANPKNLYTGSQYLYKSTNEGRDWTKISVDLTTNDKKKQQQEKSGGLSADNTSAENHCTIFTLNESPLDQNIIWVGTDDGNIQVTTDGGKTWSNTSMNAAKTGVASQTWVSSIEPSHFDKGTAYITLENHMYGDHNTYLLKTSDYGKTYTRLNSSEFTGFAHKIVEDLVNKNLLFLGTEMGLFATLDGGANWFRMKNGIPEYALVRDLYIHPKTNDLIIGTHGRGIIIIDDISPIRNMTQDIAGKDVHVFDMKPVTLSSGKYGNGGFPEDGSWFAGNPSSLPPIQYYLKERASTSDVNVEIYDAAGKLVQKIPGTKRKGLNKVYWNLRMTPPKTASGGAKLDFGGFTAPMVLPGIYTAKIKIGDKEYSQNIETKHEDKNGYTFEDRKAQFNASMQAYNMHEKLASVVNQISEKEKLIDENKDKVKSASVKKVLDEYSKKLAEFKGTLLPMKKQSMFADEKRLREDITEVYAQLAGDESKPSNLALGRLKNLENEVKKAEATNASINTDFENKVKAALIKEGLIKADIK
jgi:photosystem II stability/assembly factor-like uncharacterized protein